MKVTFEQDKCTHSGVCVKQLPDVFKVENGQFVIDTDAAQESEIIETVNACPSGALRCD